jgi:hypothetical protein
MAERQQSKSADGVAARKTARSACSSQVLARWGVLFSEARWSPRVDLAGSHLSLRRLAPIAGYIATSKTYRVNSRTALLELCMQTGPSRLTNYTVFHVYLFLYISGWCRNSPRRVTWLLAVIHAFTLPVASHVGGYWLLVFLRNPWRVSHVITVAVSRLLHHM